MPTSRAFAQVDVFTAEPYLGNPVAVVLDGDGLGDEQMQQFAAWTNLSETTFVVAPTSGAADYGLRIFTPGGELPFAGHPTLGSATAWLANGGMPASDGELVQECGVGLVRMRRDGDALRFLAPPLRRTGPLGDELVETIAAGLGVERDAVVDHQWVDNGPGWAAVRLDTAAEVLALEPDFPRLDGLMLGVVGLHPPGSRALMEVRCFAVRAGVTEDPVTGSLNAGVAQWLIGTGVAPDRYTATQGSRVGRRGMVLVSRDDDGVWVGGNSCVCVTGVVRL